MARIYNVYKHSAGKCTGLYNAVDLRFLWIVNSAVPVQTQDGPMMKVIVMRPYEEDGSQLAAPGTEMLVHLGIGRFTDRVLQTSPEVVLFRNKLWARGIRTNSHLNGGMCPWHVYHYQKNAPRSSYDPVSWVLYRLKTTKNLVKELLQNA